MYIRVKTEYFKGGETTHMFLQCSYAKRCWQLIGIVTPPYPTSIPFLAIQKDATTTDKVVENGGHRDHVLVLMEVQKQLYI